MSCVDCETLAHPPWVHERISCSRCDPCNPEVVAIDSRGWYLCAVHATEAETEGKVIIRGTPG
jgi:hypothetical protein